MARPYGMLLQCASTVSTGWRIDQMDASVAPPRLTTRNSGQRRRARSGSERGSQSPERRARRRGLFGAPRPSRYSTSISRSAGTEFHTVTPWASSNSAQRSGSRRAQASGRTIVPPAARVPKTSYTERSKPSAERANTRSSGPTPNRSSTSVTVLRAPRWSIITPLGTPVEPEVKITYARSSGPWAGSRAGASPSSVAGTARDRTPSGQSISSSHLGWVTARETSPSSRRRAMRSRGSPASTGR